MRFILGWLILIPFAGAWWLTIKIVDACIKKSDALRPLGILVSLIVGGGSVIAGYFIGPIVGWLIMASGVLVAIGGTWRSLVVTKAQMQLEERTDKRVKVEKSRRGGQELSVFKKRELTRREQDLSYYEKRLQDDAEDVFALSSLAMLYQQDERYKDMENALAKSIEIKSRLGKPDFWDYNNLGTLYLAALSNTMYGKQIPITGYHYLQNVTLDSLGYTSVQSKTLAMEYLEKASKISEQSGSLIKYRELVNLGYEAAEKLSEAAFDQYAHYIQKLKEE